MPRAKPIFGLEIEVFVKVKPAVERDVVSYLYNGAALPDYWKAWDFSLTNRQPTSERQFAKQAQQRVCVKKALRALIRDALGRKAGWKVVGDASLQEFKLTQPPDSEHWCNSSPVL